MDVATLLTHALIAAAALLQGVTGIGFALIAGPVLLVALDDAAAAPITALLAAGLSLMLLPGAFAAIDRRLFLRFVGASLVAAPLGLAMFAYASADVLKLLAGVVLAGVTLYMLRGPTMGRTAAADPDRWRRSDLTGDLGAGAAGGAMGGALAILGPPISLRMTAQGVPKERNRATVIAFFVLVYPLIVVGQIAVGSSMGDPIDAALTYAPATIVGALIGQLLAPWVSERFFRRLVLTVLIAMAAALIVDGSSLIHF